MDNTVKDTIMLSEETLTKKEDTRKTNIKLEIEDLQKFISSQAYYNKAQELHKDNKLNDAINFYKKAISLKPDYVEAYFNIGKILYSLGKYYYAIEAFNAVISFKPNYFLAYHFFGLSIQKVVL